MPPAQRFGPGAKPPCCGCGGEGVFPRGGWGEERVVSRAEAPDSRMSRAGQTLPWKSEASPAVGPARFGISRTRPGNPAGGGRGRRRAWMTLQPLREAAAGPRKLMDDGALIPSPRYPQTRGPPFPLRLTRCAPHFAQT